MKKRVFSLILACVMLISVMPALLLVATAEDEILYTSSFYEEAQAGKIVLDAKNNTVSYNGAWQAAFLTLNEDKTIEPKPMSYRTPNYGKDGNYAVTEAAYQGIVEHHYGIWQWGGLDGSGLMSLDDYSIAFSFVRGIPMYLYTVTDEGTFDISVEIDRFVAPEEDEGYYFGIMLNETLVWPLYGASYTYDNSWSAYTDTTGAWYRVTSATTQETLNEALSGLELEVKTGDRIEICYRLGGSISTFENGRTATAMPKLTVKNSAEGAMHYIIQTQDLEKKTVSATGTYTLPAYTGENIFIGWDLNGDGLTDAQPGAVVNVNGYSKIIYMNAITVGDSKYFDNLPTLDSNNFPTHVGGWQTGSYNKTTGEFKPFSAQMSAGGVISVDGNTWGGTGGGLYIGNNLGQVALSGCTESGGYMTEINYTAGYNGEIVYSFDQLICEREIAGTSVDYIAYAFALYVNDEQVWPASGLFAVQSDEPVNNGFYDALPEVLASGFPLTLQVKKGDVISFRMQQGNGTCHMMHPQPTVSYTSLDETPIAVGSSLTIGTDLSLNILLQIVAPRDGATFGVECWTSEPSAEQLLSGGIKLEASLIEESGFYSATYSGLSAKQMADLLYARPYSTLDGEIAYGDIQTFSIRDYAEQALGFDAKLDKILLALLSYGANAQDAFDYREEDMADKNISPADRPGDFDMDTLVNVYENGDGANKIKNVSMLLDNQVGFKFMIDSVEGAEDYALEFSYNADFSDSQKIAMEAVWDGREQKAAVHISLADLGRTFYVRAIVDGEAGATLTYSFDSYFARIEKTCSNSVYYTLSALAHLDRALREYLA